MTDATPAAAAAIPVDVTIGDKTLSVSPEVAAALTEARTAAQTAKDSVTATEQRLSAEIAGLKAKLEPKPTTPDPDAIETLLFTDPSAAAKRIKEEAKAELRAEMGVTNAQNAFWTDFYALFPALKGDDLVVKAIMTRDMKLLNPLSTEEAANKLGEATQKYLLERGVKRERPVKGRGAEGGNEPSFTPSNSGNEAPAPKVGLTTILRERAEAKRKARSAPA